MVLRFTPGSSLRDQSCQGSGRVYVMKIESVFAECKASCTIIPKVYVLLPCVFRCLMPCAFEMLKNISTK